MRLNHLGAVTLFSFCTGSQQRGFLEMTRMADI